MFRRASTSVSTSSVGAEPYRFNPVVGHSIAFSVMLLATLQMKDKADEIMRFVDAAGCGDMAVMKLARIVLMSAVPNADMRSAVEFARKTCTQEDLEDPAVRHMLASLILEQELASAFPDPAALKEVRALLEPLLSSHLPSAVEGAKALLARLPQQFNA